MHHMDIYYTKRRLSALPQAAKPRVDFVERTMDPKKVHPRKYILDKIELKDNEELQKERNEIRSAFGVDGIVDEKSDEKSTSVLTHRESWVAVGHKTTANTKEVFLRRLVIALITLVFLLVVTNVALVVIFVKTKCKESEETGTVSHRASLEKLQESVTNEAMARLNALEVNMTSLQQKFMENINERLNVINTSFFHDLMSVETTFESKIQNISKAPGPPGLPGSPGPPGLNGSKGDTGPQGAKGAQGNQGIPGNKGEPGLKGDAGINGTNGVNGSKGDQGPRGEKGDPGVKGDAGANGTDGAAGQKGHTGVQGDKGEPGAQGPKGDIGKIGPQGPQGAGNLSLCTYKEIQGNTTTPTASAIAEAEITEALDRRILGVSCSTNNAAEYNLQTIQSGLQNKYLCTCRGQSSLFFAIPMWCKIHYWECPLTT